MHHRFEQWIEFGVKNFMNFEQHVESLNESKIRWYLQIKKYAF